MPNPTRQSTTTAPSGRNSTADEVAEAAKAATEETAAKTTAAGSGAAGSVRTVITSPVVVARAVADDVVSTVRRPDAVLYIGGLAGLAVLGVLEWPVAAVAGVGVAISSGVRRARA